MPKLAFTNKIDIPSVIESLFEFVSDFFSTFLDGKDSGKCDQMDAKIVIKRLTIYDNDT